jgi:transposase
VLEMFLKKVPKPNGRIFFAIARGYRDENKKSKTVTVQSLGFLDELEKKYEDPEKHFRKIVEDMNKELEAENAPEYLKVSENELLDPNLTLRKNFGYAPFSKIYHELELNKFLLNKFHNTKISQYKLNNILKLLVFGRLLFPNSKKSTFENKDLLFENTKFSLKDVYRFLGYIAPLKDELQQYIYSHIQAQYDKQKKNTQSIYYDVTNYYFEIDDNDDFRRKGVSKEHRPNPIVQMGLFMDSMGFPMCYRLFPGNTNDCLTLRPMVQELQKNYGVGKVIVVADKGLNTSNNIAYNLAIGNGYVLSQSIRGANKELKDFVLNDEGYTFNDDKSYKKKSRLYPREIILTKKDGSMKKLTVDEKQVIFWSSDYAKRAKAERQPAIDKAKELIGNIEKYNKKNCYGASKYVKKLVFDTKTGEIIKAKSKLYLDLDTIKEEEKFDGYYAIVTSEFRKSDNEIIDIYRGLWKIEETFKITKSDLSARPAFVTLQEHLEAHFLTCFISLVLSRILQYRLFENGKNYSVRQILGTLKLCSCSHFQENWWVFDHIDNVLSDIGDTMGINFNLKKLKLSSIKKVLSDVKKV